MKDTVRVALLGHGFLGKWHAQKAQSLARAELTLIVEPDQTRHRELAQLYPHAQVVDSLEGHGPSFDAALVVTPTSFHFPLCEQLIQMGKHVFCEKPVTQTAEQARHLQRLLKEGQVFQVGHSERCHQIWEHAQVREWFQRDRWELDICRQSAFKGRATDVDVVQDLMIHDIDLLLWLVSERPLSVSARGFKIRTANWDHVVAQFHYASGKVATLRAGRNSAVEDRFVQCTQDKGQLHLDLLKNQALFARNDQIELETISYEKRDHLLIEQESFYRAILKGEAPMVSLSEGLEAVEYVEHVLKALEASGKVMSLS